MDISRWSETSEILNDSLNDGGSYEALVQALLRCLAAVDRAHFSADLNAISLFYPAILQDKTKYGISILLNLAAIAIEFSDNLVESIERAIIVMGDDRIAAAWQKSIWRTSSHM